MSTFHEGDRVRYENPGHRWHGQQGEVIGEERRDMVPVRADADGNVRQIAAPNLVVVTSADRIQPRDRVEYTGSTIRWRGQRGTVLMRDGDDVTVKADYDGRVVNFDVTNVRLLSKGDPFPAPRERKPLTYEPVDGTLRTYLVANMWDGNDGGVTTMRVHDLVDEIVENVAMWMIRQSGAEEAVERYYQEPSS